MSSIALQVHQISRVIDASEAQAKKVQGIVVVPGEGAPKIAQAMHRMRMLRTVFVFCGCPLCAILISVGVTLNCHWWIYILILLVELFTLWMFSFSMKPTKKTTTSRTTDENNVKDSDRPSKQQPSSIQQSSPSRVRQSDEGPEPNSSDVAIVVTEDNMGV